MTAQTTLATIVDAMQDPITFAAHLSEVIAHDATLGRLTAGDFPRNLYADQSEAFALARLAAETAPQFVPVALNLASDLSNDIATRRERIGAAWFRASEVIRAALLDYAATLEDSAQDDANEYEIAHLRHQIDTSATERAA